MIDRATYIIAHRLARGEARNHLRRQGIKPSYVPNKEITAIADRFYNDHQDEFDAAAKQLMDTETRLSEMVKAHYIPTTPEKGFSVVSLTKQKGRVHPLAG